MSQERKKGFYSAPNVPLWFTDSLAGSGGWHFPRWLRGDLPTCHRWGSALSSVCVSAAPRSQQKWSRLTAPRGPREGTHFCVVLSGHSFWEPGHRDVGKPRGPHGEVDVEGSEAADSQLTASTSASTAPPWRGVSSSTRSGRQGCWSRVCSPGGLAPEPVASPAGSHSYRLRTLLPLRPFSAGPHCLSRAPPRHPPLIQPSSHVLGDPPAADPSQASRHHCTTVSWVWNVLHCRKPPTHV